VALRDLGQARPDHVEGLPGELGLQFGLLQSALEVPQGVLLGAGLAQMPAGGQAQEVVGLEQGRHGEAAGGLAELAEAAQVGRSRGGRRGRHESPGGSGSGRRARLRALRQEILASGAPTLGWDEISEGFTLL
jgi:hypothetical protein